MTHTFLDIKPTSCHCQFPPQQLHTPYHCPDHPTTPYHYSDLFITYYTASHTLALPDPGITPWHCPSLPITPYHCSNYHTLCKLILSTPQHPTHSSCLTGAAVWGLCSRRCWVLPAWSKLAAWTCVSGTWGCRVVGRRRGWWQGPSRKSPLIWWTPSLVVEENEG